jgi:GT2 family glycosyltransferase/Tfp pilus assembly protein PilF
MKLSIVMMIKNESKHLEECLLSIKPIQAAIKAEIIIVDTGSEDNSVEIAKKYTDKVYYHPWDNDFSAMRNITIGYATGEWIFVLDGDEIIEKPEEFINFFRSNKSNKYNTGIIRIKNFSREKETKHTISLIPRIFKKDKDFKYVGVIHEQPRVKEPIYYFKTDILHYGYVSNDPELVERKFLRNTQILKDELKKDPENIYYWFQLAQSYTGNSYNGEALEANLKAYKLAKEKGILFNSMYIYDYLALIYISNNQYEDAEKICLEALAVKDGYLDLYYSLAKAQQGLLKNIEAINNYNMYLDMLDHYEDFEGSKDITVTTFTIDSSEFAYADLCILYFKEKQYENVLKYKEKINTDDLLQVALPSIIGTYIKLDRYTDLKEFYDTKILAEHEKLVNDFTNLLETEISTLNMQEKDIITDIFSDGKSVYSILSRIRIENKIDEISINNNIIESIKGQDLSKLPIYYGEMLYYLLRFKHLSISIMMNLRDEVLEQYFGYIIAQYKKACGENILSYIEEEIIDDSIDSIRIRKVLGKLLLLSGIYKNEKYEKIFNRYLKDGVSYINYIYNKNIISDERINDVKNEEEAMFIYMDRAKELKTKDKVKYVRYLKKALNIYPGMANGIELLTKEVIELEEDKKASTDELEAYKKQFKEGIQALIGKGLLENINSMLNEYEAIIKNDIDIYSIKGVVAIMEGNIVEAEKILMEGLNVDSTNFDLLYNAAYLYQSDDRIELAIDYYKQALQNVNNENDADMVYELLKELGIQENKQDLIENKAPKTSIVILTYNNLEYNKSCIESIKKYTEKNTYEIVIVDNQSTDGTVDWLKKQKDLKLILNDKNLGFPKGCNQGIEIADKNNDILLLNNDTIVTPNWLINLQKCLYSEKTIGAVGAMTNSCSNNQAIPVKYNSIQEMIDFAKTNNISNASQWEERLRLVGFCMLIRNEVVKNVGVLDEIFTPGNFEDDDYSFRIRKAGYKLMLCKDSFIHHYGSASFGKEANKYNDLLIINREKFMKKWGVDPYNITEMKDDINNLAETEDKKHTGTMLKDVNPNKEFGDNKLKFLLRRIENHISYSESILEITNGLKDRKYNFKEVIQYIEKHIIKKEMLLNIIALECFKEGMQDISLEMLMRSYAINSQNKDTVYNLSYITYKLGDIETAMTILKTTRDKDDDIVNLMNEIMGDIQ